MQIGRNSSQAGERLSRELRCGADHFLHLRRRTVGLNMIAAAAMGAVSLYQMGLVRHLPEPPLRLLDSDRVDASGEAYALLHVPDAALGLVSYAATLTLAAAGGPGRERDRPLLPVLLAGKVLLDAAGAAVLTLEQATKHRALCSYCLLAAAASFASLPQVLPEANAALMHLRSR